MVECPPHTIYQQYEKYFWQKYCVFKATILLVMNIKMPLLAPLLNWLVSEYGEDVAPPVYKTRLITHSSDGSISSFIKFLVLEETADKSLTLMSPFRFY